MLLPSAKTVHDHPSVTDKPQILQKQNPSSHRTPWSFAVCRLASISVFLSPHLHTCVLRGLLDPDSCAEPRPGVDIPDHFTPASPSPGYCPQSSFAGPPVISSHGDTYGTARLIQLGLSTRRVMIYCQHFCWPSSSSSSLLDSLMASQQALHNSSHVGTVYFETKCPV